MGKTEKLMDEIKRTPLCRQVVPLEAGVGWPIPVRKEDGRSYITFPFYGRRVSVDQKVTELFPPLATVTVDWENSMPVEYVSLRYRRLWPQGEAERPAGTFPHPEVLQYKTRNEYLEARSKLLGLYDELFEMLAKNQPMPKQWKAEFSSLLKTMVEPPLLPYYRILAPKFYERFIPA